MQCGVAGSAATVRRAVLPLSRGSHMCEQYEVELVGWKELVAHQIRAGESEVMNKLSSVRNKPMKALGVLLFAGAATLVVSGPASASTDWQVVTTDSGAPGGIAQWEGPDTFRVCDNQADGLRAWGRASWTDSGGTHYVSIEDANGAGTCTTGHTISFSGSTTVHLDICLRSGPTGAIRYCRNGSGPAN